MADQSSDFTSEIISETSLSSARSSLTYQSCSETSYADSLSTSISAREGFYFNELENAITSFRFDSLLGEGASETISETSHSSPRSSLTALSCSETSYAESFTTSKIEGEKFSAPKLKAFSYIELKNATRNFHSDRILGEGGFGRVFKGWIDEHTLAATKPGSGMVVAIKKHKTESFQGDKEWLTEVNYHGQLHHPNLVKLIGYCSDGDNRLLVYEFMPKGSLGNHLFRRGIQSLSWEVRIKVAIGAARGPESPESDVYSFGVVLLELLSGRRAIDKSKVGVEQNLVHWAKPYLGDKRKLFWIMDTKLQGQCPKKGVCMVATLALQCLSDEAKYRPRMTDVLATLEQLQAPKIAAKRSNTNSRKFPILSNTPH